MLHLSRLIGRPVRDSSADAIGVIDDLIAAVGTSHPPITGLVVRTGRRRIYLGWSSVERMDAAGATILATRVNISRFRRRDDEILLKGDLLDKQIVDIDGRKVVRANDAALETLAEYARALRERMTAEWRAERASRRDALEYVATLIAMGKVGEKL